MKVDQAKSLKQLEQEKTRLNRLVGELHLEKAVLPVGPYPAGTAVAIWLWRITLSTMRVVPLPST
jgi:hypothetical protein